MPSPYCPVPINQQPLEEYKELSESWFFSWPIKKRSGLYFSLFTSWLLILPINLIIFGSSFSQNQNLIRLCLTSGVISIGLPILLLIRLLIGWDYVCKRLTSIEVEYEETGWQDGNCWKKPESWLQKDLLIAQHVVKPIIRILIKPLIITSAFMTTGILLCQTPTIH
ncbi:CGLD27 family protein [Prochlorococcus sp. MIT 1341]|uniref:CGLD27 family protein n=1 Tax=Prochlorococcus sp. MIT 1341 TaxID=3096221 RepID=UPI002A758640|nr:CGLD27 family protein [Prochlorococcus sp. MIT 1341]